MKELKSYAEKLIQQLKLQNELLVLSNSMKESIREVNEELKGIGGSIVINIKGTCVLLKLANSINNRWEAPACEISISEEKATEKLMLKKMETE